MTDSIDLVREFGPWAGTAVSLALALRAWAEAARVRESASAKTVAQLRTWLTDALRRIEALEDEVRSLRRRAEECEDRERAQAEVIDAQGTTIAALETKLAGAESRGEHLVVELEELRRDLTASGHLPRPSVLRALPAEHVIDARPSWLREPKER